MLLTLNSKNKSYWNGVIPNQRIFHEIRNAAIPQKYDRTQPSHFYAVVVPSPPLLSCTSSDALRLLAPAALPSACSSATALLARSSRHLVRAVAPLSMTMEMLYTRSKQVIKSSKKCKIHMLFMELEQGVKSSCPREVWTAAASHPSRRHPQGSAARSTRRTSSIELH